MDPELKQRLKSELFFLDGVEDEASDPFLDGLPEPVRFRKGDLICGPDREMRGLGILVGGRLKICPAVGNASMRDMTPVNVFGAAALFGGDRYVSGITANRDCEIIFVPEEELSRLMRVSFRVTQNYIRFLSDKIRFLNRKIGSYAAPCAADALYGHLRAAAVNGRVAAPANMRRLAQSLGIGRTSLYRAVETLTMDGCLLRDGNEWIIMDRKDPEEEK